MTAGRRASAGAIAARRRMPGQALARYYDLDLESDPGDLELYLALARRSEGPILELAVGSGRLAVPLAAAGHEVTGIDLDAAALSRARDRWRTARRAALAAGEAPGRLRLLRRDLLTAALGPRFGLAFLALNSLLLFPEPDLQAAVVAQLARHLRPDGLAAVDIWLPSPDELAAYDGRLSLEWERPDEEGEERVAKVASARHDPATSMVELTTWYDAWPEGGGPVHRTTRTDRLRLLSAAELTAMARTAGLVVEALAGDYALTPFGPGAERAVLLARRPSRGGRSG